MFFLIIKHEWRTLSAERSFLILAAVFAVLLGYGIYNGASWIKMREANSRSILAKQEKELAERKEKTARGFKGSTETGNQQPDPSDPYAIGMSLQHAVLPFAPTAVFSLGQADVLNSEAGVTISTLQRTKADKSGFENPLSFLAGRFDLSFVIVYLLPLLIFAASFNLLSGEREAGTLQLLLAQPLRLSRLLTAKVLAQLALILGVVFTVSIIGFFLSGANFAANGFGLKLLLWLSVVAAYGAFWFAIAVLINSFGFSSAANALAAAATWLVLVLILPSLLNIVISSFYPVPSRTELVSALRSVNLDTRRDGSKILAEYYQDHPELMPKDKAANLNNFSLASVYVQREQKKLVSEVEDRFAAQLARQQALINNLRFLSPSVVAQEALNDLAGTGLPRHAHFRGQVKEFDRAWADYFVPRIFRQEKLSAADFDQIPSFSYREEPIGKIIHRAGSGVLFLFAASIVFMLLAFKRLKKYQLAR